MNQMCKNSFFMFIRNGWIISNFVANGTSSQECISWRNDFQNGLKKRIDIDMPITVTISSWFKCSTSSNSLKLKLMALVETNDQFIASLFMDVTALINSIIELWTISFYYEGFIAYEFRFHLQPVPNWI